MAGSIKAFEFVQNFLPSIGIYPSQSNQKRWSINPKNVIILFCMGQAVTTLVGFLIVEAHSMLDYGFGFYVLLTSINGMVTYSLFIWQKDNTFEYIGNCEGFIGKSE